MRQLNSYWHLLLPIAVFVMFCDGSSVVGQEPNPKAQQLTLDSLDSLEKTGNAIKNAGSDFSLSLLDQAGPGNEASSLVDFRPQSWKDNLRFTVDVAYRPSF